MGRHMRRFEKSERTAIVQAFLRGDSDRDIMERWGCSRSYPVMMAKRAGYDAKDRGSLTSRRSPEPELLAAPDGRVAEIQRLKRRGLGITSIAAMLRVPYREVVQASA